MNFPVEGVVPPIAPGDANVAPPNVEQFKFGTLVVDAIVNGAVPVVSVEVITPVALSVVKAPLPGVTEPIAPGAVKLGDVPFVPAIPCMPCGP